MDGRRNNGGSREHAGRKTKAEEMGLNALLGECWTLTDRQACIRKLAAMGKQGDLKAIELLMSYAFGKPRQAIDANLNLIDWRAQAAELGISEQDVLNEAKLLIAESDFDSGDAQFD